LGETSIILDRADGNTVHEYLDLSRMIYLEDNDTYIPATYQGAPKVCFHCRIAGHERKYCPELASIQCYKCKGFGRLRRHCKLKDIAKPVENLHSVIEVVEEEENDAVHSADLSGPDLTLETHGTISRLVDVPAESSTSTDVPPPVVAGNSPSAEVEMEMDSNMDSQEGSVVEVPNPTESLTQDPVVDESMVDVSEKVPPFDIEPVIATKEALAIQSPPPTRSHHHE
jgi:hypothetical protein